MASIDVTSTGFSATYTTATVSVLSGESTFPATFEPQPFALQWAVDQRRRYTFEFDDLLPYDGLVLDVAQGSLSNQATVYVNRRSQPPPCSFDVSVAVASSANPSVAGQPSVYTATVSGVDVTKGVPAPTGKVQFTADGKNLGDAVAVSGNQAKLPSMPSLPPGNHQIAASYSGDPNFKAAQGTLPGGQTVNKATPSISTTPSGLVPLGARASDVATISGGSSPAGTVTFKLYGPGDASCSNPISTTTASLGTSGTASSGGVVVDAPGTYRWTASYSGDANNNPVTSPCGDETTDVAATPTIHGITSGGTYTAEAGRPVSFTVTAQGLPGARFSLNGQPGWLSINAATGAFGGTPPLGSGGVYVFTVTASSRAGEAVTQNFHLTVDQAPSITSTDSTRFTATQSGTFAVTSQGHPTPMLVETGSLPSGVNFSDNHDGTATISGTPASSALGVYSIAIQASNGVGVPAAQSFALIVVQGPGSFGYWLAGVDGQVLRFGAAELFAPASGIPPTKPAAGMAATPTAHGYWVASADGGVVAFGDAALYPPAAGTKLNSPIVGMAATPSGRGYWLVAADGTVVPHGDAAPFAPAATMPRAQPVRGPAVPTLGRFAVYADSPLAGPSSPARLTMPIVGMAATYSGRGYWVVAADGGVAPYGDATLYPAAAKAQLNKPIVGMAVTPSGLGYWVVAADGGVAPYGDAAIYPPAARVQLNKPIVGMAATPSGRGYWVVAAGGGVAPYGDAAFVPIASMAPQQRIVGIASRTILPEVLGERTNKPPPVTPPPTQQPHGNGPPWIPLGIGLAVLVGTGLLLFALASSGSAATAMLRVGKWRRSRLYGEAAEFASAPPPVNFDLATARSTGLPDPSPSNTAELLRRRGYDEVPDGPEVFRRAALWTVALRDAVRGPRGVRRRIRGLRASTIGFVQAGSETRLAAIFYVRFWSLLQAAPTFVTVDGYRFPVVIRPMFVDRSSSTRLRLPSGMVTCSVKIGGASGVLTAAHVAAKDGNRSSLRENDTVSVYLAGSADPSERRVLRADPVLDAAVVEDEPAGGNARSLHAYPFAGYFPIEMRSPQGATASGHVVEMEVPEGVITGAPGQPPSDAALFLIDVTGQPGWSGSMVWEAQYREFPEAAPGPRPYGMFVGVRKLHTATLGRVHMLRQIERVWELQILED